MIRRAVVLLLGLLAPLAAHAEATALPQPPELDDAVDFWVRIYSEVPTTGGLLHDPDNLAIVYERLSFDEGITRPERSRQVRQRKAHYREQLRAIATSDRKSLTPEQRELLAQFPQGTSDRRLREAAQRIRFQLGQSDRFRAGLKRSGAWEPHIRRTLDEMGLPRELAALPHVESSFNPDAWSAAGAAGIWQFTRATGQRYMRVDRIVDARVDPFKSSVAAARLLDHNHSVTNSWPLALTAYNHGLAGVRRAVDAVGTKDFGEIVERYDGRNWGFASRNFYAAFLAAVEVDFNAPEYFESLERREAIVSETVELPFFASASDLSEAFDVPLARLRELNRDLRDPVWKGSKRVPRGFPLRVPAGPERAPARELLARVDRDARYYAQIPDRYHTVQWGEALSTIARRYDVSTQRLVAINDLSSAHSIRAGQTLRLPLADTRADMNASDPVYTVEAGDTLSGIAQRVGMTPAELAKRNDLADRDTIQPGQQLRVDSRPAEAPRTAAEEASGATDEDDAGEETVAAMAEAEGFALTDKVLSQSLDSGADDARGAAGGDGSAVDATARQTGRAEAATAQRLALSGGIRRIEGEQAAGESATFGDDTDAASGAGTGRAELAADPADYGVADDATIEIQAAETLGHYAEWLDLRASQLRRINNMRYGDPVVIGRRLALDFSRVSPEQFRKRRLDYHEQLQGRFFERFQIAGTQRQVVEKGDSLWSLARRSDNVPVWLLRQYNPDLDFSELKPGMPVTLPQVQRQPQPNEGAGAQQAEAGSDGDAGEDAGT